MANVFEVPKKADYDLPGEWGAEIDRRANEAITKGASLGVFEPVRSHLNAIIDSAIDAFIAENAGTERERRKTQKAFYELSDKLEYVIAKAHPEVTPDNFFRFLKVLKDGFPARHEIRLLAAAFEKSALDKAKTIFDQGAEAILEFRATLDKEKGARSR